MSMRFTAGERIRIVRELLRLTRDEFSQMFDLDSIRLRSVEVGLSRASESEYQPIGLAMPELLGFLICEQNINLKVLDESNNKYCNLIAGNIRVNKLPKSFQLHDKIDDQ